MTMVLDSQGRQYGGMNYDHIYSNNMQAPPSFSNPWSHQTSNQTAYPSMSKAEPQRSTMSMPPYSQLPPTSAPIPSGSDYSTINIGGTDSLSYSQDMPRSSYGEHSYSSPQTASSSYATSFPTSLTYAQSLSQQQAHQQRKMSEAGSDHGRSSNPGFPELDASRGMLALSHQSVQDLTPRNIYDVRARAASDSYGFPQTLSNNSSISNESGRGYPYYASSVGSVSSNADSGTDYSSAASDAGYDTMASRTLPRPQQLMGAPLGPPAPPQSMMGQFSSKMSANTQKKHKCKVCDKRFTRPSSLQTHMYSHTGEKPFACNVEGCGRHFSVVSNLRRHKKVHKGETVSNASDADD